MHTKLKYLLLFLFFFMLSEVYGQSGNRDYSAFCKINKDYVFFCIDGEEIRGNRSDYERYGKEYITLVTEFEHVLSKQWKKEYDNYYQHIFLNYNIEAPFIIASLVPKGLGSYEDWKNGRYKVGNKKIFKIWYNIKSKNIESIRKTISVPQA